MTNDSCPLCACSTQPFHQDRNRQYWQCSSCEMVIADRFSLLNSSAEKAEYDKHQNSLEDEGYRRFLSRIFQPLMAQLESGSEGLDYGCGPGPALAAMFEESGHSMALYDLYYQPDTAVLQRQYDFITMTEVVEHLKEPLAVIESVWSMLKAGGCLGVMTKLVRDREAFAGWHYKNDPTHITFFSQKSIGWLAEYLGAGLEQYGADAFVLTKAS